MDTPKQVPEASRTWWRIAIDQILVTHPFAWSCAMTALVLFMDYVSGPDIRFPITYLIPVSLAAWSSNVSWMIILGITMPIVRLGYVFLWKDPFPLDVEIINSAIDMFVLLLFAFLVSRVARIQRALSREVEVLEGLLPICSFCKKIRNQDGQWEAMESYITDRSKAQFSHGVCPECITRHYGDYLEDKL